MKNRSKYFEILGISPTTDQGLIKKAYRKKAMAVHPDRNTSPNAQAEFVAVTEAYELLSGQQKIVTPIPQTKTAEEIKAEKIRKAKMRYREMQEKEKRQDELYFERITTGKQWAFFRAMTFYTAIFALLICADQFLTREQKMTASPDFFSKIPNALLIEEEIFIVDNPNYWHGKFPPVQKNYGFFFKDLKSINLITEQIDFRTIYEHSDIHTKFELFQQYETETFYSYASVYYVFPYFQFILFTPLLLLLYKRPNFWFSLWRLVSIWAIFPVVGYLSLWDGRIFRLIGLL